MNKTDLTKRIAAKMNVKKKESASFIEALMETMAEEMQCKEAISLQGFGTFLPWEQTEREGRNPKTGTTHIIRKRLSVKFKPGKYLLEAINTDKK